MGFDAMINTLRSASLRIRIQYMFQKKSLSMFVLACLLAACGGGGDSSSSSTTLPGGSIASIPGADKIVFSGYRFNVRSGKGDPGPNNWSRSNVWVDANGYLHLKISNSNGVWSGAEISTPQARGFGTYQFKVIGYPNNLDKNVVFGFFPYTTPSVGVNGTNEIDIEFASWGNDDFSRGHWAVWPSVDGNSKTSHSFDMTPNTGLSTHRFTWTSRQVSFRALKGLTDDNIGSYADWTFAPQDYLVRIPQSPLPLHLNMWLFDGKPPANGQEVEMVISELKFIPE